MIVDTGRHETVRRALARLGDVQSAYGIHRDPVAGLWHGGGVSVICPALPGALSVGATREEALANVREAIRLWLDVAIEQGDPIPSETQDVLIAGISVTLSHRQELGWDRSIETAVISVDMATAT